MGWKKVSVTPPSAEFCNAPVGDRRLRFGGKVKLPDSPWPANGGRRFQLQPLLGISNHKYSGVGPQFSLWAKRHPDLGWRETSGEPSVHEVRTRWSLIASSNEQTAAKHAQSCSGNRSRRSAVAEESRRGCPFGNAGKFLFDQQLWQGCGGVSCPRRRRWKWRHHGLFGRQLRGRGIAAAVGGGWFAAGGAGVIHYRAQRFVLP